MPALAFDDVLAALEALPLCMQDLARLRSLLASIADPGECIALIEQAAGRPPCPRCHATRVHRCGSASGLQRYRCCRCGRSYNALSGTPLARLRLKEKWLAYLQCVLASRTVRDAAAVTGVHRTTSFRWRHRFIPGAMHERAPTLSAIVEADETYLLESQKGSRTLDRPARKRGGVARRRGINRDHACLLVARDRSGQTLDFHTGRGPVTAAQLERCLRPVLAPDVLLVSDAAQAYKTFAARAGITHEAVNLRAGIRTRGAIHLQNVNGWHSRFKTWLLRFRGVASRYLIDYSGWQRILDDKRLTTPALLLRAAVQFGKRLDGKRN
ncbi:IS1595 family transposase [uncultured Massilia sp.]|uniref:IS1595 family transposase n=1 Tax=uncultured Massilia sp. TaxID=169973 RepID=UPI0025D497D2|nr:IS1595 family transposase [uncultured Massilia sp.]